MNHRLGYCVYRVTFAIKYLHKDIFVNENFLNLSNNRFI